MRNRFCLAAIALALSALAAPAAADGAIGAAGAGIASGQPTRLAQATAPVVPSSTSATCLSGCNSQSSLCQNTCISTINGTTVIPSITSVGVTTSPNQCVANCSSQLQQCQRNCALQ